MSPRIPQGVEVLVKKASIDAEFKQWLLAERARAAERIGLELQPAETAMLDAVPADQLEAIIAQTMALPPEGSKPPARGSTRKERRAMTIARSWGIRPD